jgi:peptidoglycan/LPS O-acetylase OafA/YrhL
MKISLRLKVLFYALLWFVFLGFIGPCLISAPHSLLVMAGVLLFIALAMLTVRFVEKSFLNTKE